MACKSAFILHCHPNSIYGEALGTCLSNDRHSAWQNSVQTQRKQNVDPRFVDTLQCMSLKVNFDSTIDNYAKDGEQKGV